MGKDTAIRWTNHTWPIINGCRRVSPGCGCASGGGCYAERLVSTRLAHMPKYAGLATMTPAGARWSGEVRLWEPHLREPVKWNPSRVFVCDMGDLFYDAVPDRWIDLVFRIMREVNWHDYQILTKRPERAKTYLDAYLAREGLSVCPPHIWIGTSIETDGFVHRANVLRSIPATVRFISAEPLLGPLPSLDLTGIDWLIVGGESGPDYRPMDHAWARELRAKARSAVGAGGVPMWFPIEDGYEFCGRTGRGADGQRLGCGTAFYFKQSAAPRTEMGMDLDGRRYEEYPQRAPTGERPEHVRLLDGRTVRLRDYVPAGYVAKGKAAASGGTLLMFGGGS